MNVATPSPGLSLLIVGKSPEFAPAAIEAFQRAFPGATTTRTESTAGAIAVSTGRADDTLLALTDTSGADVATAVSALDKTGLPRWGVVVFGEASFPDTVTIPRKDWDGRIIMYVFRLALALHRLRRENARFRGDLSTLGTRVVHDLRSPLGGVLTTAEVLKEVLADEAPSRVPLLDPMVESTDGLTKLIRQMSVITKASSGTNPKQRFNMSGPFWAAFQRVEREALSLGATIAHSAAWPDVEGEPAWIESMWHALLSNALHYTGAKPRIEAGWKRGVGENRFWLVDGGEVPREKRAALFQPFHLLHHPNGPRGFGLPIVQRLAELQGGHCGYEPAPGGGSCFFFTLPTVEAAPGAGAPS